MSAKITSRVTDLLTQNSNLHSNDSGYKTDGAVMLSARNKSKSNKYGNLNKYVNKYCAFKTNMMKFSNT